VIYVPTEKGTVVSWPSWYQKCSASGESLGEHTGGDARLLWIRPIEWDQQDPKLRTKEGSDMLVLSRKLGEKIQIGEDICITVVDIDRGKIRLGIEAPREVPIFRQELLPLGVAPTRDEPAALLVH
jgi:carbon storage regulator